MSAVNDGGPAFPVSDHYRGMTLRDWFAGQAFVGFSSQEANNCTAAEKLAAWSYEAADAMLAAREQGGAK